MCTEQLLHEAGLEKVQQPKQHCVRQANEKKQEKAAIQRDNENACIKKN
jgi:hypothetical protein